MTNALDPASDRRNSLDHSTDGIQGTLVRAVMLGGAEEDSMYTSRQGT